MRLFILMIISFVVLGGVSLSQENGIDGARGGGCFGTVNDEVVPCGPDENVVFWNGGIVTGLNLDENGVLLVPKGEDFATIQTEKGTLAIMGNSEDRIVVVAMPGVNGASLGQNTIGLGPSGEVVFSEECEGCEIYLGDRSARIVDGKLECGLEGCPDEIYQQRVMVAGGSGYYCESPAATTGITGYSFFDDVKSRCSAFFDWAMNKEANPERQQRFLEDLGKELGNNKVNYRDYPFDERLKAIQRTVDLNVGLFAARHPKDYEEMVNGGFDRMDLVRKYMATECDKKRDEFC